MEFSYLRWISNRFQGEEKNLEKQCCDGNIRYIQFGSKANSLGNQETLVEEIMAQTAVEYVEKTVEGSWRLVNSRVSLDSVIHAWWDGKSPESIVEEFPTLSSEQVYGAIAFYLHNKTELKEYFGLQELKWKQLQEENECKSSPLLDKLRARKKSSSDGKQSS